MKTICDNCKKTVEPGSTYDFELYENYTLPDCFERRTIRLCSKHCLYDYLKQEIGEYDRVLLDTNIIDELTDFVSSNL